MFSIDIENGSSNEYIKVISDENSILWYLLLGLVGLDIAYFNLRLSVTRRECCLEYDVTLWRIKVFSPIVYFGSLQNCGCKDLNEMQREAREV